MSNLKKPKPVDKKVKSRGLPPKAKATTKLENKLKARKKAQAAQRAYKSGRIDRDTYLKHIEGN